MAHIRLCLDRCDGHCSMGHRGHMMLAVFDWRVAMVVLEVGTLFLDYGGTVAKPDLSGHAVALFGN